MSFSYFIARRLYSDSDGGKRVSRPAVLIALIGIAVGLAVMLVTVAIVVGFKREVRAKVTGFSSDIQLTSLEAARSYETTPVVVDSAMMHRLHTYPAVAQVQRFSTKPGIIKTEDAFQGMVLKGVGQEYDSSFFAAHLLEGEFPQFSDSASSGKAVISKTMADKLMLSLGDKIYTYFVSDNVRVRPMVIAGIYSTNFSECDNLYMFTDLYTVTRLNGWEKGQVTGAEIRLDDYSRLDEVCYMIGADLDRTLDSFGSAYYAQTVEGMNPQIFEWLELLDLNVVVILILMIGVAGFTMISGLLILIIERTNMIGVLKALGADNFTIRKVFLWFSVFLIGKGMLWGNAIGLLFCAAQSYFKIFKLDPQSYYIDSVPIQVSLPAVVLLNVATLVVAVLMLIGPSFIITKINPATSMRYE